MKHQKRNLIAALAAAMLLTATATAAGSVVLAHDGAGGPSRSPKPVATHKVLPTRAPKVDSKDCSLVPAASPTAAASSVAVADANGSAKGKSWGTFGRDWPKTFARGLAPFCTFDQLKALAGSQANGLLKQLSALNTSVAKSGLSDADKATLKAEIDAAIADVTALKTKVGADATLDAVKADLPALKAVGREVQGIKLQVRIILASLGILAAADKLDAQVATLQAQIDAAPASIDKAAAQKYLDDMKARVAEARTLAGPLKAQLIALSIDQVKAGKADPTLAAAFKAMTRASLDVWHAKLDARTVAWIVAGKPGFGHKVKPSPSPSATPAPTA
jgi:hypothetical protein